MKHSWNVHNLLDVKMQAGSCDLCVHQISDQECVQMSISVQVVSCLCVKVITKTLL